MLAAVKESERAWSDITCISLGMAIDLWPGASCCKNTVMVSLAKTFVSELNAEILDFIVSPYSLASPERAQK